LAFGGVYQKEGSGSCKVGEKLPSIKGSFWGFQAGGESRGVEDGLTTRRTNAS